MPEFSVPPPEILPWVPPHSWTGTPKAILSSVSASAGKHFSLVFVSVRTQVWKRGTGGAEIGYP